MSNSLSFYHELERPVSTPRLSFSTQEIFNLRNARISELSKSSPGIYSSEKNLRQQRAFYDPLTVTPKSILVKKEDSLSEINEEEEIEESSSYNAFRFELQFTAFVILCFVIVIVVPLSMIIIGSIYLFQCPVQIMIPVFLIVGGTTFLIFMAGLRKLNKLSASYGEDKSCFKKTFALAVLIQLGWFITGCYWIYGAYEPDYFNEESSLYCHKTLYQYSFWFLNTTFLVTLFSAVLFTTYVLFGKDTSTDAGTKV